MGAQFTKEEGERLIQRTFDPSLDESINRKRVLALMRQIRKAAEAKQAAINYWNDNDGTLKNFKGKQFGLSDFREDLVLPGDKTQRRQPRRPTATAQPTGAAALSDEQLRKNLGLD